MCIIRRAYGTIFRIGVAPPVAQSTPPPHPTPFYFSTGFHKREAATCSQKEIPIHRLLVFISSREKQHVFSQCYSFPDLDRLAVIRRRIRKRYRGCHLMNNMKRIPIKNTTFNIKYLWGAPGWERVQTAPLDTVPPLVKGWPWGRRLAAESLWWSYCPWEEEKEDTERRTSQHGEKYGENLALKS